MNLKRVAITTAGAAAVLLAGAQLVPYGKSIDNPPTVAEPLWASSAGRDLARRACYDCHSHETVWPWYAKVAPVSWLVYHDVAEGRRELNFSDWKGGLKKHENMKDIAEEVNEGEMPPRMYRLGHPEAKLAAAEKEALLASLAQCVPAERPKGAREGR